MVGIADIAPAATAGPGLRQHHVARLEIAVHDALAVRALERAGDLDGDLQRFQNRNGAALQPRRERLAFQELHDEKINGSPGFGNLVATDVMERADVGMRQR